MNGCDGSLVKRKEESEGLQFYAPNMADQMMKTIIKVTKSGKASGNLTGTKGPYWYEQ